MILFFYYLWYSKKPEQVCDLNRCDAWCGSHDSGYYFTDLSLIAIVFRSVNIAYGTCKSQRVIKKLIVYYAARVRRENGERKKKMRRNSIFRWTPTYPNAYSFPILARALCSKPVKGFLVIYRITCWRE